MILELLVTWVERHSTLYKIILLFKTFITAFLKLRSIFIYHYHQVSLIIFKNKLISILSFKIKSLKKYSREGDLEALYLNENKPKNFIARLI